MGGRLRQYSVTVISGQPPAEDFMTKKTHPILSSRFISTLAILAALALPGLAQQCSPNKPTVGRPVVGTVGITETVEQIMAREALNPSLFTGRIVEMPEHDEDMYKRPNPKAPKLAQWPPPPNNNNRGSGSGGPPPLNPQPIGINWLGGAIGDTIGYVP